MSESARASLPVTAQNTMWWAMMPRFAGLSFASR